MCEYSYRHQNEHGLRVIRTGRNVEEINRAASLGLFPLVKPVVPSDRIADKYRVDQDVKTGKIEVSSDFRKGAPRGDYVRVIDYTFYYQYHFESPFAAYLVPSDLEVGERVFLEDLIEDYVGSTSNQGRASRLRGCEAIWNGKEFEIQYDPETDVAHVIG